MTGRVYAVALCALGGSVAPAAADDAASPISIRGSYSIEVMDIASGGVKRGATIDGLGRVDIAFQLDETLTLNASAYGIHRSKAGPDALTGSLGAPSNIDALSGIRLNTVYLEKSWGQGSSMRVGQLAADDEFSLSDVAGGLINGAFGWPDVFASNLPNGGPAYPLPTPGVRLAFVQDYWTLRLGAFSGDPAGDRCATDPQVCDRNGITVSFHGGVFAIAEAEWHDDTAKLKLGGWYHSAKFADQHFGVDAGGSIVSLASSSSTGALMHRGDWGAYAIADVKLGDNLAGFARLGAAPGDRNLISFYADAGLSMTGTWLTDADVLTAGISYSGFSPDAAALDRDVRVTTNPALRVRTNETVLELDYQAQLTPQLIMQPDVQYIAHPGGNALDQNGNPVHDAVVVGLRFTFVTPTPAP